MGRKLCVAVVMSLLAVLVAIGCESQISDQGPKVEKEVVKVGVILPLTGEMSEQAQQCKNGIELAIADCNEMSNKEVQMVFADDAGDPEKADEIAKRFIGNESVTAVIGPMTNQNARNLAALAKELNFPLIVPASTGTGITGIDNPWVTRICFTDEVLGKALAEFVYGTLKVKNTGVLVCVGDERSRNLADDFATTFSTLDADNKSIEVGFDKGATDLTDQVKLLKARGAEVVVLPTDYTSSRLFLEAMQSLSFDVPAVGTDRWETADFLQGVDADFDGAYILTHFIHRPQTNAQKVFVQEYTDNYGENPSSFSALGYDAGRLLCLAIDRLKTVTVMDLRDQINSTKNLLGITGNISIDENGNANKTPIVLKVENGTLFQVPPAAEEMTQ